jgi:hypothetical protein
MRSRSLATRTVRGVIVFVHGSQDPTDEEWGATLELYRRTPEHSSIRCLVYSSGGAPNVKQRARLREVGQSRARIAVLTASAVVRAAGVAVSWFNPKIKIYGLRDIENALDHLEVPVLERSDVRQALEELKNEMRLGGAQLHP